MSYEKDSGRNLGISNTYGSARYFYATTLYALRNQETENAHRSSDERVTTKLEWFCYSRFTARFHSKHEMTKCMYSLRVCVLKADDY